MKSIKLILSVLAFTAAGGICAESEVLDTEAKASPELVKINPAGLQLHRLMDAYWNDYIELRPMEANLNGDMRNLGKLQDVSEAGRQQSISLLDRYLKTLSSIPFASLDKDGKVNFRVFEWMLKHERRTLDFDWHYYTFTSYAGWHSSFASAMQQIRPNTASDYKAYVERLNAFPKYTDQHITLMRAAIQTGNTQPCESLVGYGEGISGYIKPVDESSFYTAFKNFPKQLSSSDQKSLSLAARRAIKNSINPSYQKYTKFYQEEYLPACRKQVGISSVPDGAELYDHFVKYYTTVDTNAEAVHALGLSEVARIRGEMKKIISGVNFKGSFKEFLNFLRTDEQFYPKTKQDYLAAAAFIAKKVDGKLPEYFSFLPRNPYGIEEIPMQIAPKVTPAYYQGGAADGTRSGKYYINTYNLKSRPLYELPALTLHEAVPGHHLQISIQNEMTTLPDLRRFYYFHPFGEGWALYSEFLGEEMGIYTTDYERFGRLTYEMWRALRLVVDTGMHAKGWSRERAINLMADNSALSLHNITTEVDRYITWPGQALAYKMGELKIRELRALAENELGEDFNLREFHSQILTNGAVPLTVMETMVKDWLGNKKR